MKSPARTFRIGVDIGGTFTDFTVLDDRGAVTLWKEDSTPHDPAEAILRGVGAVANELGLQERELLGSTRVFVHGSTIATNAVIERSGSKVGLLCTGGFRDVLYLRDGFKWDRFNVGLPRPRDFVERYLRLPAVERIDSDGDVVVPLDENSVRSAARRFVECGVEAVAIAFIWSVVNPAHEHRAAELLREVSPQMPVVCSADVLPEIREWQRTSAAVLSAYALPKIEAYLRRLEVTLEQRGLSSPLQVMQINGGCSSVSELLRRPVYALHSGPAAAPAAALFHGSRDGAREMINVDMGGTSFDVSLIRHGRPVMSREIEVEHQPIGVPGVEVHSIGAGGGSVAWIDSGGALRVGPRSAGARPGPVAYGAGGVEPTVTDANVVLGYLAPKGFLGGRRRLRDDLATKAIATRIGKPLGLDAFEAAAGIFRVVNAHMIDGIRHLSVERGVDPRGFALVSGGGAGSVHATRLARSLGMSKVLIPREAATFCAFGMTVTDVRHDATRALRTVSTALEVADVRSAFAEMEEVGRRRLRAEGFTDAQVTVERSVDARYLNQVHELTITVPLGEVDEALLTGIEAAFHAEHHEHFSYDVPGAAVEYLHWRVSAVGSTGQVAEVDDGKVVATEPVPAGERLAYVQEAADLVPMPVFDLESLGPGGTIRGPAIIDSPITTVVLNPGDVLRIRQGGSLVVDVLDEDRDPPPAEPRVGGLLEGLAEA